MNEWGWIIIGGLAVGLFASVYLLMRAEHALDKVLGLCAENNAALASALVEFLGQNEKALREIVDEMKPKDKTLHIEPDAQSIVGEKPLRTTFDADRTAREKR
jgi:hypothetical protein